MSDRLVYLDNNSTTQVASKVVDAMIPCLDTVYANPGSLHSLGSEAALLVDKARHQVANLLGCSASEVVFTSGGSESDNLAILGVAARLPREKRNLVTSKVEHSAVKKCMQYLARNGFRVSEINVDSNGMLDLEEFASTIDEQTGLISIMYANNETGVVFPVEEIGKLAKQHAALFHVDAVQAIGKIPIHLAQTNIDLLSISGHKFHGPKGVGALYVKKGISLQPQILGGAHEHGLRAGTEAVHNIVGLGVAAELAAQNMPQTHALAEKRNRLEHWVLNNISATRLNGHDSLRLGNTANISFRNLQAEAIVLSLSQHNICVSSGSACNSGTRKPSTVLQAMKVPGNYLKGAVRFSLSRYNTEYDIDYTIKHLPRIITKLRKIC